MSLTSYTRVSLFWGALTAESGYSGTQNVDMGASAQEGSGIGLRRAQLVFSRTAPSGYSEDTATTHFDFVNYTGGNPDDSWITSDFTTLETAITTWWTAIKPLLNVNCTFREIRWYRKGPGVVKPNPAARVTPVGVAATGAGSVMPPQVAISITFKTGLRKRWGRTYLPDINGTQFTTDGRVLSASCDTICTATNVLATSAASSDFIPVVYSPTVGKAYAWEQVQVDNIFDVIRSRRWDSTTYRKTLP